MSPLNLSTPESHVPNDVPALIQRLSSRPQPALVHYSQTGERVELSGRVLANWTVKLVGLFREESEAFQEVDTPEVIIHTAVGWKAAACALAATALGANVHLLDSQATGTALPETPDLVISDAPRDWLGSDTRASLPLGGAELAALAPGMLDNAYEDGHGPLPAWVLDIAAEVRQHPDQLLEPLPLVTLNAPSGVSAPPKQSQLVTNWHETSPAELLNFWAHSATVVMVDSDASAEVWKTIRSNEKLD